jgi:hypothetical protein
LLTSCCCCCCRQRAHQARAGSAIRPRGQGEPAAAIQCLQCNALHLCDSAWQASIRVSCGIACVATWGQAGSSAAYACTVCCQASTAK